MGLQTGDSQQGESVWRSLQKLKVDLPCEPTVPLVGVCPQDLPSYSADPGSAMFTATLFTVARKRRKPKSPAADAWVVRI